MPGRSGPFNQAQDYLPRLKAVFFARWDEDKGCEITYQVPENSIGVTSTAPTSLSPTLHHHRRHQHHQKQQQQPQQRDRTVLAESDAPIKSQQHYDPTAGLAGSSTPPPSVDRDRSDTESNQDQGSKIREPPDQSGQTSKCMFEFTEVIDFILPKKHLCGHLVTITSGSTKVLGFPTLIEDEQKYERNFFMFNLCFVFDKDSELLGYEPIVRKTGRVLRSLEEKNSLLSTPNNSSFEIKSILEELFEELNSFSEVSISLNHHHLVSSRRGTNDHPDGLNTHDRPEAVNQDAELDDSDKDSTERFEDLGGDRDRQVSATSAIFLLNLKLFPFYGNPPRVYDWNVPVSLVSFSEARSEVSWDLTMFKLVPFIDGTTTVRKIARLADVDIYLARECIQHLVFSNSYKLIGGKVLDLLGDSNDFESIKLQEELKDYISIPPVTPPPAVSSTVPDSIRNPDLGRDLDDDQQQDQPNRFNPHLRIDHDDDVDELFLFNNDLHAHYSSAHSISDLLNLYNEFKSGITVHDWMEQNEVHKLNIDVRRFISFGTIKGFLKRLHCYPIWALHPELYPQANHPKNPPEEDPVHRSTSVHHRLNHHHHHHLNHSSHHRLSSSAIRLPAWLAVLKRLNHPHPLLSPHRSNSNLDQHLDHSHPHDQPVSSSHARRPNHKPSRRSTLISDQHHSHRPHPSSPFNHPHPHHPSHPHPHHHHSIAVHVPKDLPLKLDGSHHLDELCVQFKISLIQLEQILRYIDTLSLEEFTISNPSSNLSSAMQTVYY